MAKIRCDECGDRFHPKWKGMDSGVCSDCYRAEQKRADKESADRITAEHNLPSLTGSAAQIEWATKVRADFAKKFVHAYNYKPLSEIGDTDASAELWSITSAHWWIDRRNVSDLVALLDAALTQRRDREAREKKEAELAAEAESIGAPSILKPSDPYSTTVATVSTAAGKVYVQFPEKLEDFRLIMRNRGFDWEAPHWVRNVGENIATHRAAEICAVLLEERYIVTSTDAYILLLASEGTYAKEVRRRITTLITGHEDMLAVLWPKDDDFYASFMRLRGAKFKNIMLIPVSSYEDLMEWGEKRGFKVEESAKKRIDAFKAALSGATTVDPVTETPKPIEHVGAPARLAVPTDVSVDPSLMDA